MYSFAQIFEVQKKKRSIRKRVDQARMLNTCLDLTPMPSRKRRQLMAELADAGLDDDELGRHST